MDLLLQHGVESVPAPVNPNALSDAAISGDDEVVRRFLEIAVSPTSKRKSSVALHCHKQLILDMAMS